MNEKIRLGVIFGGRSGEHEVSLMSTRSILSALNRDAYEVIEIGITHEGTWLVGENVLDGMLQGRRDWLLEAALLPDPNLKGLYRIDLSQKNGIIDLFSRLDVVFPVLHGSFGEDGTLQGLLELADLAYVGAGVLGSALGMDKGIFKDVMRANGIPIVDALVLNRHEISHEMDRCLESCLQLSAYPLFVKPANLGSSVGITKCKSRTDLLEGLAEAARFDRRVIVEKGIEAREIEVSVLGNETPIASLPGEILPSREFYSYEAKYLDEASELLIPAPIPQPHFKRVQELAVQAYRAIDCAGMARVDFLLEKTGPDGMQPGRLYLNELNTIPGFTKISMYPKLWEASGIPYPELLDRLIRLAIERKEDRDQTERRYRTDD